MPSHPENIPQPVCPPACYLHRGIDCIELFDYPEEALPALRETVTRMRNNGCKTLSFHTPMPRPAYYTDTGVACTYLHEDSARREISFALLDNTLTHAKAWQADYVVTHLTYGKTDTHDPERATVLAAAACARFAALSRAHMLPIDVEFAAYTATFNSAAQFAEAVAPHPELGLCIDTGHAMLGARLNQRDYFADIRTLAPRARSMHLWNTLGDSPEHIPLHPAQSSTEGWIDLEQTLRIALAHNPEINIVFEYPVAKVDHLIQSGYDWIKTLKADILRN